MLETRFSWLCIVNYFMTGIKHRYELIYIFPPPLPTLHGRDHAVSGEAAVWVQPEHVMSTCHSTACRRPKQHSFIVTDNNSLALIGVGNLNLPHAAHSRSA